MKGRSTIAALLAGASVIVTACVEQLRVEDLTVEQRAAAADIRFYENVGLPEGTFTKIGPVEATSCRNMAFEPAPTRTEALNQLRIKAAQLGADGVIQYFCTASAASFAKNCWQSVTCSGTAVKFARGKDGRPSLGGSGSGFFVNAKGDVVTNAHVTRGCKSVTVERGDARDEAPVAYEDPRTDLALVRTGKGAPAVLALRTAPLQLAEGVLALGFPEPGLLARQMHVTDGVVSALAGTRDDTRMLQFTAPIQGGNSGGPLVDLTGNLVGVNTSGIDPGVLQNVNFAIKSAVVAAFLDSVGAEYKTAASGGALPKTEVAASVSKATVRIVCRPQAAAPTS